MLYFTQTIISTNSEIYIPTFATIVGSRMSSFERGNTVVELPALVYTVLPIDQENINDNSNDTAINRVLNRSSRWNPLGFTSNITKVRVFLIPGFAQTGGHVCTYGVPTTNRHVITQFSNVKFKGEDYSFYVETLVDNPELPPLPSTPTNRQNTQQLGPAVRAGESIRIIN